MDTLSTTYIKAVDEMSAKIFIPALICSLFVEVGPNIEKLGYLGFWGTYLIVCAFGFILGPLILYLLIEISIRLFKGQVISDIIGLLIMPLGFDGLLDSQFIGIEVPFRLVIGVAILAWSFMLVRHSNFLNALRELL